MNKEEMFNYLDKRLGVNTKEVKDIKNYIETRDEILEKIEEYIEKYGNPFWGCYAENILEILGDKEIKEIPQFKGTLEQLDNLTILGDKENGK